MSLHDETEYLDILKGYTSEDTRRARRNLSFIAFTIILISATTLSLSDVTIFGLHFTNKDEWKLILFTATMLVYWWVMYHLYFKQDAQIYKEHGQIYGNKIRIIFNRHYKIKDEIRKQIEEEELEIQNINNNFDLEMIMGKHNKLAPPTLSKEFATAYKSIHTQTERTLQTQSLKSTLDKIHRYVPHVLASIAIILLYWKFLAYLWCCF